MASHVVANVIAMHVEQASDVVPGESQETRLRFINDDIRGFYTDRRVQNRMPPLKMSNLYKDGFPELHGSAVKAANTRALVPYAMCLQERAAAADPSAVNKHCLKVVQSLNDAIELMYAASYFLTEDEGKVGQAFASYGCELSAACCSHLQRWSKEVEAAHQTALRSWTSRRASQIDQPPFCTVLRIRRARWKNLQNLEDVHRWPV